MAASRYSRHEAEEEHASHERWLVSYADFITLLLAFFVVMYSISSVNTGKFRVLSDALQTVFTQHTGREAPIDLGGGLPPAEALIATPEHIQTLENAVIEDKVTAEGARVALAAPDQVEAAGAGAGPRQRLERLLEPLVERDDVKIRDGRYWTEFELSSELLFRTGSADLNEAARPILERMAPELAKFEQPIRVEGFTDDVPIAGGRHASNWHLSAARAATVAEGLMRAGIPPTRLTAAGFGEFRPIADNGSAAGRRKNRRVVIAVAKYDGMSMTDPADEAATGGREDLPARTLERVTRLPPAAEMDP